MQLSINIKFNYSYDIKEFTGFVNINCTRSTYNGDL